MGDTNIYSSKFEKAFRYLITNEGGFSNVSGDPGGKTKYGISQRSYPHLNIEKLTLEDAKKIYYKDFWLKGKCEEIEYELLAMQVFDFSVNLGIRASTVAVQRGLKCQGINVSEDGVWGIETHSSVKKSDQRLLLASLKSEVAGYYRLLAFKNPSFNKFLNGWLKRAYKQIII